MLAGHLLSYNITYLRKSTQDSFGCHMISTNESHDPAEAPGKSPLTNQNPCKPQEHYGIAGDKIGP